MSTTAKKATVQTTPKTAAQAPAAPKAVTKKVAVKKPALSQTAKPQAAPKSATKTAVKPAKSAKVAASAKATKATKVKKPKLVRDSFTIPKDEYEVLDSLKLRAVKLGQSVKKSELLRAGIKALAAMSDAALKAALSNVPTIKTGRPKSSK